MALLNRFRDIGLPTELQMVVLFLAKDAESARERPIVNIIVEEDLTQHVRINRY